MNLPADGGVLQTDLVRIGRAIPIARLAARRDLGAALSTQHPATRRELLKLGIDVGQTSVAKYMAKNRRPPSQGWKTFLRNHANGIASIDLFVVPTIWFQLLYGLLILIHGRREILCLSATEHPSAEWISRQLTEAYGGRRGLAICCAIGTGSTARSSGGVFGQWAYGIGRPRHGHDGRMAIVRG
jgi:hypothetical protein